jgi:hypothetical protein
MEKIWNFWNSQRAHCSPHNRSQYNKNIDGGDALNGGFLTPLWHLRVAFIDGLAISKTIDITWTLIYKTSTSFKKYLDYIRPINLFFHSQSFLKSTFSIVKYCIFATSGASVVVGAVFTIDASLAPQAVAIKLKLSFLHACLLKWCFCFK